MAHDAMIAELHDAAQHGKAGTRIAGLMSEERARLFSSTADGVKIAEGLSRTADAILRALYTAAGSPPLALVAVGGYGRGRLAPYSDIDLLVLAAEKDRPLSERVIYPLFDSGLPLSQSVHDPKSAASIAETDITCRTAFLDARMIAGDKALFDAFERGFDRLRQRTGVGFVEAKLSERDERHAAQDASRYAIEPDVKEGKGGLRDLDLLHWVDRYVQGLDRDPSDQRASPGLFEAAEARQLVKASDFLWSVRVHLHDLLGRADERLSFDVQPALAARLGYKDRRGVPAAERLMKHYFINATTVGTLTNAACAALEERALKATPLGRAAGMAERLWQENGFDGEARLVRRGGRLSFDEETGLKPRDLFALFLAAGRHRLEIHPTALAAVTRAARRIGRRDRADPENAAFFRRIVEEVRDLERVLRRMTETGLLGRYLPAFGAIVGKAEYGLFRRYTLDEHVLRACGVFAALRHGPDDGQFPVARPLAAQLAPMPVVLALLLQETDTGLVRPTRERLKRRVRTQARRLMPADKAEDVVFAVERRDLLAETAARRAVTEPEAVESVARQVGTRERLDLLLVATACRHRTAGVGSWRAYRNRDAKLLYDETAAFLAGGKAGLARFAEDRRRVLRQEMLALAALPEAEASAFLDRTADDFWSMASPAAAAALAETVSAAERAGETVAARVEHQPDGTVTAMIVAPDRPGLFADIAGVISEAGATVWGASGFELTAKTDGAPIGVTVFEMLRPGTPPSPLRLSREEERRLHARLIEAAAGGGRPPRLPPPGVTDRRAVFDVPALVRTFRPTSGDSLIVEAEGRDRPGLLHLLADEIEKTRASIRRAFVATYGEKAIDTFYLQSQDGKPIEDERALADIRGRLMAVLEA